jgi:hypothetical protein
MAAGCCINRAENSSWWLQGGSGWAISRHATEEFLKFGADWAMNATLQEDVYFSEALVRLGLDSEQVNSPYFSGHFLWPSEFEKWDWENERIYRLCPEKIERQDVCNHKLVPYRSVVFHHSARLYMGHKDWDEWLAKVPDDAMIWYDNRTFRICRRRFG